MRLRRRDLVVGGLTLLGCASKARPVAARAVSQLVPTMPTIDGAVRVGATEVPTGHVAVLRGGDLVQASGVEGGGRVLLLAGRPLNEPVARSGPFVMNTEDELRQAWADYRAGVLTRG
jgi:redox-sensitive bicupin YhaK (pirin superfamily)